MKKKEAMKRSSVYLPRKEKKGMLGEYFIGLGEKIGISGFF